MIINQNISCPVCNSLISIDIQQLLSGAKFICPSCNSSIEIAEDSKSIVEQTVNKLKGLKDNFPN